MNFQVVGKRVCEFAIGRVKSMRMLGGSGGVVCTNYLR